MTIKNSQWILSCFGPWPLKKCIPNFIEDQSFEEVRLLWYEAKKEHRLSQFQQKYNLQVLEAKYKMVQLTFLSSEVLKMLTKIYDSDTEPNKNIFIGATNPFSSTALSSTNNSCIFGINQIQTNPFAKSTSIKFGSNTTTTVSTNSIFGSGNASSSFENIFENNTQKQSSIFGSELVITKQQKNPFADSLIKQSQTQLILSSHQTKQQKSGMMVRNSQNKKFTSPNKLFSFPSILPNSNVPIDSPFKAICPPSETTIQKTLPNPNESIDSPFKAICPPSETTIQKTLPNPNESIDSPFKAICPPSETTIQKTLPNPNESIDSPFKAICPPSETTIQKTLPNPNESIDSPFKAIGRITIQKTLPNPNESIDSPFKAICPPSETTIQKTLPNPNESIDSSFKAICPPSETTIQKTLPNPNESIDSPFKAIGPPSETTIQKTLPNPNESIDSPFKAIGPPLGTAIQKTFDWDSSRKPFAETEFKNQINRLEKIIERLERLVPEKQLKIAKKLYNSVIETTEQLQNQCTLEDTLNNNQEDGNNSALNLNNNLVKHRKEGDNCREGKNTSIISCLHSLAFNKSNLTTTDVQSPFLPSVLNMSSKLLDVTNDESTKIKRDEKISNGIKPLIFEAQTSTIIDVPLSLSPPQFKKIDKKWIIEHQKSNQNLLIKDAKMDNMIKMYQCENSILTIKGKVNSVFMDSCKKCYLFVDSVVSSIEFVNCQSVQMQILKKCPTISIKKTDGCQMYLTKNSLDVEILSSKSSKMNAMIPKDNGDYIGQLIPEQYRTLIKGTSLQTTCVESEYFLK